MTRFPAERNTRPIGSSLVLRLPLFSLLFKSTPRECARTLVASTSPHPRFSRALAELGSAADFDNRSGLGCRLHRRHDRVARRPRPGTSRVKAGRTAQRQVGLQDRVEAEAGPDQQTDQRPTGAAQAAEPGAPRHPRAPNIGPVRVGPEPVAQRLVPLVPSPAIGRSREAKLLRNSHRE